MLVRNVLLSMYRLLQFRTRTRRTRSETFSAENCGRPNPRSGV